MMLSIFGISDVVAVPLLTAIGGAVTWIANREWRKLKLDKAKMDFVEEMRNDLTELNGLYAEQLRTNTDILSRVVALETDNKRLSEYVEKLEAENKDLIASLAKMEQKLESFATELTAKRKEIFDLKKRLSEYE